MTSNLNDKIKANQLNKLKRMKEEMDKRLEKFEDWVKWGPGGKNFRLISIPNTLVHGRYSGPEVKQTLEDLEERVRAFGYIPIYDDLFNQFEKTVHLVPIENGEKLESFGLKIFSLLKQFKDVSLKAFRWSIPIAFFLTFLGASGKPLNGMVVAYLAINYLRSLLVLDFAILIILMLLVFKCYWGHRRSFYQEVKLSIEL